MYVRTGECIFCRYKMSAAGSPFVSDRREYRKASKTSLTGFCDWQSRETSRIVKRKIRSDVSGIGGGCEGGLAGNGGCHGCPSSERHVGNRESIQMLGRYVTVLRKRTRQCKAPNGVLDNTKFTMRDPARDSRARNPFVQLGIKCANANRLATHEEDAAWMFVNNNNDPLLTRYNHIRLAMFA